jgi:DNA-directed RNA polymerase subunit L
MSISNLKITSLKPDLSKLEFAKDIRADAEKLLPTQCTPEFCSFEIKGVSNAIYNAICRTISSELPVAAMDVGVKNICTNDHSLIPEMIINRLRLIPVMWTVPPTEIFSIDIKNATPKLMEIKSSDIKSASGGVYFNETFTICTLAPASEREITYFKMSDIRIKIDYGYVFGGHCAAVNVGSKVLDEVPINTLDATNTGISSSISKAKDWQVQFVTNGNVKPKTVIIGACESLMERLMLAGKLGIESRENLHSITIPDDTHTIANILMRTICDNNPNVTARYVVSNSHRESMLELICNESPETIINDAIKYAINIYSKIGESLI